MLMNCTVSTILWDKTSIVIFKIELYLLMIWVLVKKCCMDHSQDKVIKNFVAQIEDFINDNNDLDVEMEIVMSSSKIVQNMY